MPDEPRKKSAAQQFGEMLIEREMAYAKYSLDEKRVHWQGYFVENLFRGSPAKRLIDVAAFRLREPDFDLFIDDIADALAESTGEDRDEILLHCFLFDADAKRRRGL